jgi:hypothetical protein
MGESGTSQRRALARVALLAPALLLAACSFPRYYASAEYALGTDAFFASQAHFAVYYPAEIALDFPGYLVGIEMGERNLVLRDGDLVIERPVQARSSMLRLADNLRDGRNRGEAQFETDLVPFVSQVLRYRGQPMGAGNCALFSSYQARDELMPFCDGPRRPRIEDWHVYRSAFADSWEAIDVLKTAVQADAASGRHTHLVVAMMGWRTTQEEAIRNFNSLMRAVRLAAGEDFRPLFIGISWVGPWSGRLLDPLVEFAAYGNIADLADTLGLTWVGVLTDEVVLPLSRQLHTTYITHSFGARAGTTAICIGPAIRRDRRPRPRPDGAIDRLVGFQAAFSLQRFLQERLFWFYEDVYFPDDCARARSVVLTTTVHDSASKTILWADLAGNPTYFKRFCRRQTGRLVSCTTVDASGAIDGPYDPRMKVLYLDATRLLRYRAPGTDGGAHSDVFRPPIGRLLWSLMAEPPAAAAPAR